ncbi:Nucleotide-binding oligomerization domain-containing protein 2 (Caspase recruitment domain-containing protein 15) [Durusdinium trenchii]|uniref:Nucleotide-binding oligomerization domain-containing protein 2 (Caspase recruitment domain-containing protein 15) n=1 Tax=Durusdinium trenchii TaxID=1381693 RepID=A0ABP0KLY7_9DINO
MALPSPAIPEDMAAFDEEENEVRGTLVFRPPVEILPKTRRTEEMQKRKIELLKKRKEDAENLRKEKEKQEAQRRQQELQVKKEKQRLEQQKKAEERKRREEEEQRKKMEGGLDRILHSLMKNVSAPDITVCGIDLNPARLRLLAKNLSENTSCRSIDLNRKGLIDDDGVSLAGMLEKNQGLLKLECEGNNLGVQAAEKIGEALRKNDTLRSLNLESNNLTASGGDQKGIIKLADALQENKSLRVLMLSKNGITAQAGEYFARAIEANDSLTLVDLSGNDASPSVEQLRRIDAVVRRNRERLSGSAGTGDGGGGATQLEGGSVELGALGVRDRFRTYHES